MDTLNGFAHLDTKKNAVLLKHLMKKQQSKPKPFTTCAYCTKPECGRYHDVILCETHKEFCGFCSCGILRTLCDNCTE